MEKNHEEYSYELNSHPTSLKHPKGQTTIQIGDANIVQIVRRLEKSEQQSVDKDKQMKALENKTGTLKKSLRVLRG